MTKCSSNLIPSSIGSATEKFEMMQTNHSDSEVFTSASEPENENISTENSLAHNLQVKLPCEYAETCYRKNPSHFHERSHPGDSDWWDPLEESPANDPRPECEYGVLCYQKQDFHRRKFKHTKVDCNLRKRKAATKVKKIEIESDSDKFSGTDSEHEWSDENSENFKSENISVTPAKLSREAKELIEDSKFVLRTINCRR